MISNRNKIFAVDGQMDLKGKTVKCDLGEARESYAQVITHDTIDGRVSVETWDRKVHHIFEENVSAYRKRGSEYVPYVPTHERFLRE